MSRSQDRVYLPPRQACPVSPSSLSVNSVLRRTRFLTSTDPSISDTQERPQPLSAHALPNAFRHTGGVLPRELKNASRFSAFSPLGTHLSPLRSIESALMQNEPITRLESALPKTQHLKPFRIRTYEKTGGRREEAQLTTHRSLLLVHCTPPPSQASFNHRGAKPHA
jgi:hypothetical protein